MLGGLAQGAVAGEARGVQHGLAVGRGVGDGLGAAHHGQPPVGELAKDRLIRHHDDDVVVARLQERLSGYPLLPGVALHGEEGLLHTREKGIGGAVRHY